MHPEPPTRRISAAEANLPWSLTRSPECSSVFKIVRQSHAILASNLESPHFSPNCCLFHIDQYMYTVDNDQVGDIVFVELLDTCQRCHHLATKARPLNVGPLSHTRGIRITNETPNARGRPACHSTTDRTPVRSAAQLSQAAPRLDGCTPGHNVLVWPARRAWRRGARRARHPTAGGDISSPASHHSCSMISIY